MGCNCGMSCWRRLRDWQAAGVWGRLHQVDVDLCQDLRIEERTVLGAAAAIDPVAAAERVEVVGSARVLAPGEE
jgi:transposase